MLNCINRTVSEASGKIAITVLCIVLLASVQEFSYAGDILTLTNARKFEGKITKIKNCQVHFRVSGTKYQIPASEIYSIKFENKNSKVYTSYLEALVVDPAKCVNGRLDAINYHGKKSSHIALGFLFGPFAMLGTALSNPSPQKGQLTLKMSEHADQFDDPDYLNCYRKKAKGRLLGAESIGFGIAVLMVLTITPTYLASK